MGEDLEGIGNRMENNRNLTYLRNERRDRENDNKKAHQLSRREEWLLSCSMVHFTSMIRRMQRATTTSTLKINIFIFLLFLLILHSRSSAVVESSLNFIILYFIFIHIFLLIVHIYGHIYINKREVQFITIRLSPLISSFTYYYVYMLHFLFISLSPSKKKI